MSRAFTLLLMWGLIGTLTSVTGFRQQVRKYSDNPKCYDNEAAFYACKLLTLADNGSIILWKTHPSGRHDDAYAYNNIRDTCQGYAAARSNYTCKECPTPGAPGGYVCLNETLVKYIYSLYQKLGFIRVNEIAGACHSCKSKHYMGRAVDIHSATPTETQTMLDICRDMAGVGIDERSHIHCQFNPITGNKRGT